MPPKTQKEDETDPHDLISRYVKHQKIDFNQAFAEIRAGEKHGHWIWWIILTPPFIVKGVERGSHTNQKYALRSDEQVML